MKNQKNKKGLIGILVLIVAVIALAALYLAFRPGTSAGEKTVTLDVVVDGQTQNTYTVQTTEEYLGAALLAEGIIQGEEGAYGLFVQTVDGITADDSNQEWWCLTKGGEQVTTGVDTTPIADQDAFEFTLMVGY